MAKGRRSSATGSRLFWSSECLPFVVPFVPPPVGGEPYTNLPYWTHAVAGWATFGIGFLYWLVWAYILPQIGGYTIARTEDDN